MSNWEVAQPLDYSATGDDIDSASQKIIATFADVYDKLNRLRNLDASADHSVGDASPFSIKVDTSVNPPAILMRNAENTGYVQVGSVAENMGITANDVGAITGTGIGHLMLGAEASIPATASTYDFYFAYDTGRVYIYRTGAWRVFLSLRFEDLLGVSDVVIKRDEVAKNGANKIPRLNSVGQGEFDITGSAAKIGGKNLYLPNIADGQVLVFNGARNRWEVAPRDDITDDDVSTTGEPDKIVKTDSSGKAHIDITGSAAKVATKTIDVSNLQDGDILVYDATHGTFINKQGAVVNDRGVVEGNLSGSASKWAGKSLQTISLTDGQILVWSESNQAFINRNQGSVGSARALVISQDGEEKANYNGDSYRAINIITPHLRVASQAYTVGQTCFSKNMSSTMYLECVTAGVTQAVEPDFTGSSIGDTVADGGVEWKVCGYVSTEVTDAIKSNVTALQGTLQNIDNNNYRQPDTLYTQGTIRSTDKLPAGWYLECVTEGTTESGDITFPSSYVEGATFTDGTATWAIRKTASTYDVDTFIQNNSLNVLKRSHAYEVGDIAYSSLLKSYQRLECVVGGTTASTDIDVSTSTTGGVIVDGTCTWLLTDTRDGTPVGAVRGSLYLPAGYIKANGAEVQRADYPRLVALADTYNLWREETVDYTFAGTFAKSATTITAVQTDDMRKIRIGDTLTATGLAANTQVTAIDYSQNTVTISVAATAAGSVIISGSGENHQNGLFGRGDGDSTFVLPDYTDRMIQLADTAGLSIDAGLPNITGVASVGVWGGQSGAFYANPNGKVATAFTDNEKASPLRMNASCSNPIYGNSDTVQPPAITLIPIIRY